jgi:hypothetical protein
VRLGRWSDSVVQFQLRSRRIAKKFVQWNILGGEVISSRFDL